MTKLNAMQGHAPKISEPSRPMIVNVYIDVPRGGFGDIAANLSMAQKIRETRSNLSVNVLIHAMAIPLVETILPGFDKTKSSQTINGIKYFVDGQVFPKADVLVGFAVAKDIEDRCGPAGDSSPYHIWYAEFGEGRFREDLTTVTGIKESPYILNSIRLTRNGSSFPHIYLKSNFEVPNQRTFAIEVTSGALDSGIYLSKARPPSGQPWKEFKKTLEREIHTPRIPEIQNSADTYLAFSYSKFEAATQLYAEAIFHAARHQFKNKTILLLIKQFANLTLSPAPDNVIVLPYSRLKMSTMESIIAQANLPIMITGDGSLSEAFQHEKVFFYELNLWKNRHIENVARMISSTSPYFSNSPDSQHMLFQSLMVDSYRPDLSPGELAELFSNWAYQTAFRVAMSQCRLRLALPENFHRHLMVLKTMDPDDVGQYQMGLAIELSLNCENSSDLVHALMTRVQDELRSNDERILALSTLFCTKLWKSADLQRFYWQIISSPKALLRTITREFFALNLHLPKIRFILEAGLSEAQPHEIEGIRTILTMAAAAQTFDNPLWSLAHWAQDLLTRVPAPRKHLTIAG